jgi:PqqD family protein of HPr-rel-A system
LTRLYRRRSGGLIIRPCAPHFAVFDPDTGRTHVVTDVACALLDVAAEPGSAQMLAERVAQDQDWDVDDSQSLETVIEARLAELASLGLIELVS